MLIESREGHIGDVLLKHQRCTVTWVNSHPQTDIQLTRKSDGKDLGWRFSPADLAAVSFQQGVQLDDVDIKNNQNMAAP